LRPFLDFFKNIFHVERVEAMSFFLVSLSTNLRVESSRICPLKWRSFSDVAKMSLIVISHHAAWFVRSPLRGACYFRRRIWQVEVAMGGAGKPGGLMITEKRI